MVSYTPRHEDITGASLSGSSGAINRTYTLVNDNPVQAQMNIILAENVLQNTINYTFVPATGVVTFLGVVFDAQNISFDYLTTGGSSALGSYYCTTLQITRAAGIGFEIYTENLGTGDNSNKSFDMNHGNVIDTSYVIKYAASGSNDFTTLTETTHYIILKDQGLVELTSTGVTALSTNALYADYVYSPRQSETVLALYLPQIGAEVDKITGNYWGTAITSIEYFDGYESGYPQTDEPYGEQIEPYPEYDLKYKGINAITSVLFLDRQGNTDTTLESTSYRVLTDEDELNDYQDSRLLINTSIPNGKANIKVTYTHGYAIVPDLIQELAAYVGGMMALVNISGGSYKDVSTYTLGRKTFSIGQVYVNIRESIDQMKSRIDSLVNTLGGNFDCV